MKGHTRGGGILVCAESNGRRFYRYSVAADAGSSQLTPFLKWIVNPPMEEGLDCPVLQGLPLRPVAYLALPQRLRHFGLQFEEIGPRQPFKRFALRSGVLRAGVDLTGPWLKKIKAVIGARLPKNAKVNNANLVACIVATLFSEPTDTADLRLRIRTDLLRTSDAPFDELTAEAIAAMDPENQEKFKDLSECRLPKHVHSFIRGPTLQRTPTEIRAFVPWRGKLPGCFVHRSSAKQFFTAYYPGAATCTRVWGRTTSRTEGQAMEMVLQWQWDQHFEQTGETRPADLYAPEPPDGDHVYAVTAPKKTAPKKIPKPKLKAKGKKPKAKGKVPKKTSKTGDHPPFAY